MFKNYLKIALRNIKRHKGYSFINIVGLAIGMACCIMILFWVQDELSYNKFHEKADSLYLVRDYRISLSWHIFDFRKFGAADCPVDG